MKQHPQRSHYGRIWPYQSATAEKIVERRTLLSASTLAADAGDGASDGTGS